VPSLARNIWREILKNTSLAIYATKPPLQIASGNQFPEAAILHKSPMNAFTLAVFLN